MDVLMDQRWSCGALEGWEEQVTVVLRSLKQAESPRSWSMWGVVQGESGDARRPPEQLAGTAPGQRRPYTRWALAAVCLPDAEVDRGEGTPETEPPTMLATQEGPPEGRRTPGVKRLHDGPQQSPFKGDYTERD